MIATPLESEVGAVAESASDSLRQLSSVGTTGAPGSGSGLLFRQSAFDEEFAVAERLYQLSERQPGRPRYGVLPLVAILGLAAGVVLVDLGARAAGVNSDSEAIARAVAPLLQKAWPYALGLVALCFFVLVVVALARSGIQRMAGFEVSPRFDDRHDY